MRAMSIARDNGINLVKNLIFYNALYRFLKGISYEEEGIPKATYFKWLDRLKWTEELLQKDRGLNYTLHLWYAFTRKMEAKGLKTWEFLMDLL
jgi:hypothetical protein